MFTQCPDCQTTFRVSAEVLQKAQGRVRCGGCGNAFNALDHLSKDETPAPGKIARATKEKGASDSSATDQRRKLLDTLDKLAGADVRIEDTGVEWRVVEYDEADESSAESQGDSNAGETGSLRFVLEDEIKDQTPAQPVLHGRHDDLPPPKAETQESLDLPGTGQVPSAASHGERRYDDNTILPDDFGVDDDLDELPFLSKQDSPKRRATDREEARDTTEFDEAQVELALGDPDDWVELLDEVADSDSGDAANEAIATVDVDRPSPKTIGSARPAPLAQRAEEAAGEAPPEDMPSDIDSQFLLQAEEMGLDTGKHRIAVVEDAQEHEDEPGDLAATDIEDLSSEEDDQAGVEEELTLAADAGEQALQASGQRGALAVAGEPPVDEIREPAELELEAESAISAKVDEVAADQPGDTPATTMIGGHDVSKLFDEGSDMVETIIMEGDIVHDALKPDRRASLPESGEFETPGPLDDTYSLSRGKIRGGRRASDPASYTVIASVVVLALVLLAQIIHQSRQSLATYGAFNQTIGSIYRVLGKPVTPDWDIRGWRFEVTNGSVDEEDDLLTIYSRIANKSSQPLPYPLVHVSLTDRWEETIGSRVLEPNDYLAGGLDPRKPVPPGEDFTAVITIASPSAEATGFKLNVCYRIAPGRVRCATEDFKN
jgi:predicted Zn finger-like uncharacterized protein